METFRIESMKNGWFVGNFEPAAFETEQFEACYKVHKKGEKWDTHYHKAATEINLLVSGKMTIQNKELVTGDIFVLHPFEIANPIFLEDCTLVILKTPSKKNDKYAVNDKHI